MAAAAEPISISQISKFSQNLSLACFKKAFVMNGPVPSTTSVALCAGVLTSKGAGSLVQPVSAQLGLKRRQTLRQRGVMRRERWQAAMSNTGQYGTLLGDGVMTLHEAS